MRRKDWHDSEIISREEFINCIEKNNDKLFYYILRIVRNEEMAFDVLQNTLMIAFEKRKQLRAKSKAVSWIYSIAKNEAFGFLRAKARDVKRTSSLEVCFGGGAGNVAPTDEEIQNVEDTIIANENKREEKELVKFLLGELSFRERKLIIQLIYYEKTFKEIAAASSENEPALRMRYYRSLKKMEKLQEDFKNE